MSSIPRDAYGYATLRIKTALRRTQKHLNLSACKLKVLPPLIGELTHLHSLNLSNNALHLLPPEIGQLSTLRSLNLSGNALVSVLPDIGKLTNLKTLDLSGNKLCELPAEIGDLEALELLDLRGNPLKTIPFTIHMLRNLRHLEIGDKPVETSNYLPTRMMHFLITTLRYSATIVRWLLTHWAILPKAIGLVTAVAAFSIIWTAIVDVEILPIEIPNILKADYTLDGVAKTLSNAMRGHALDTGIRYVGEADFISSEPVTVSGALKYRLAGDQPSLTVPTTGLSTETISQLIRKMPFLTPRAVISGQITQVGTSQLHLQLYRNGDTIYVSTNDEAQTPEAVIEPAIDHALSATDPYFHAAVTLQTNPAYSKALIDSAIPWWSYLWTTANSRDLLHLKALALQSEYDSKGAIDIYSRLVKYADPRTHLHFGLAHLSLGNFQEATCRFLIGINIARNDPKDSTNGDLLMGLSRALGRGGRTEGCPTNHVTGITTYEGARIQARLAYREAATLHPKASSFLKLGNALFENDADEAKAQYLKAITIHPTYSRAYFYLGELALSRGDIVEAAQRYDLAVKFDPSDAEAHYRLGGVLHDLSRQKNDDGKARLKRIEGDHQYEAAVHLYNFIRDSGSDRKPTYNTNNSFFNLGIINAALGHDDEAINNYNHITNPTDKLFYSRVSGFRGYAYFSSGDFVRAESDFAGAAAETKDVYFSLWRFMAASRLSDADKVDESREALRSVVTRGGGDWPRPVVQMFLGEINIEQMKESAGHDRDKLCEANFYAGEWHWLDKNRAAAVSALSQAIHDCPEQFHESAVAKNELKRVRKADLMSNR
jgi:tetratricopeptide (TPR) repeat protein